MKNYINTNSDIYAYEDDTPQEFLDAKISQLGLTPISDQELVILRTPSTEEQLEIDKQAHKANWKLQRQQEAEALEHQEYLADNHSVPIPS